MNDLGNQEKMGLRQRNNERMRQRIIETALELFMTQGYDRTTMDNIAEQAEVGRATVFKYFPSKATLLLPLAQNILTERLQPKLMELWQQQPPALTMLEFLYRQIGQLVISQPELSHAFIREFSNSEVQRINADTGFYNAHADILRYGQARSEIRTDLPLDALTLYVTNLYRSLFVNIGTATAPEAQIEHYEQAVNVLMIFLTSGLQPAPKNSSLD